MRPRDYIYFWLVSGAWFLICLYFVVVRPLATRLDVLIGLLRGTR